MYRFIYLIILCYMLMYATPVCRTKCTCMSVCLYDIHIQCYAWTLGVFAGECVHVHVVTSLRVCLCLILPMYMYVHVNPIIIYNNYYNYNNMHARFDVHVRAARFRLDSERGLTNRSRKLFQG